MKVPKTILRGIENLRKRNLYVGKPFFLGKRYIRIPIIEDRTSDGTTDPYDMFIKWSNDHGEIHSLRFSDNKREWYS